MSHAELAARELGELSLADALDYSLLLLDVDPERWPRAAGRWHARFAQEAKREQTESVLLLAAVIALAGPARSEAAAAVAAVTRRHRIANVERAVLRLAFPLQSG